MAKTYGTWLTVASLALALAACGQSTSPGGGFEDAPWAMGNEADTLSALSLSSGVNYLSDQTPVRAESGWGPYEKDTSNGEQAQGDGHPITLNGTVYHKGLGVHSASRLVYNLRNSPANCVFTSDVGMDDEVGTKGSVVFRVLVDGEVKFDSGKLTGASATKSASVDLTGAKRLALVVAEAGDGKDYDHADWAGARITCGSVTPTPTPTPTPNPTPSPAPGSLDSSFSGDGLVILPFSEGGQTADSVATAVAVRPDGKVLTLGSTYGVSRDAQTVLLRLGPDGNLDAGFGSGGQIQLNLHPAQPGGSLGSEGFKAISILPDDTFVVGGSFGDNLLPFPVLARFLDDGRLDTSFGNGGLIEMPELPNGTVTQIIQLADGKLLVNAIRAVRRYTADGHLDPGFGSGGSIEISDQYGGGVSNIARQSAGRLLVLTADGILKGYTPDGQLDPSFGTGGQVDYVQWRAEGPNGFSGVALQLLPGDQMLVGLSARTVTGGTSKTEPPKVTDRNMLVKQAANGSIDASFGQQGRVVYENLGITDIQRQPNGKFLSYPNRFNADGTRDFNFVPPTNIAGTSVTNVAFQSDGKILLAASQYRSTTPMGNDLLVARLNP